MRITAKINLQALKNAFVHTIQGQNNAKKCICIPIDDNFLYVGQKSVYLDLIGFELDPDKRKGEDTHLVKQSLPKAVRDNMSDEERRQMPIIGNFRAEIDNNATTEAPLPF